MPVPNAIKTHLNEPYPLTAAQIDFYQKNRLIKLRDVLNQQMLSFFNNAITKRVALLNTESRPLEERTTYERAFLQLLIFGSRMR